MRAMVILLALAACVVFAATGCGSQCNGGCESGVTLTTTLTTSTSLVASSTVCAGVTCVSAATSMDANKNVVASFAGGFGSGTLTITPAGDVNVQILGTAQDFHDGDVWSLRLDDAGGTALLDSTSPPVTYQQVSACGVVCAHASIAL